jgi:hypothetical protein
MDRLLAGQATASNGSLTGWREVCDVSLTFIKRWVR